jgi:hypothetical protein
MSLSVRSLPRMALGLRPTPRAHRPSHGRRRPSMVPLPGSRVCPWFELLCRARLPCTAPSSARGRAARHGAPVPWRSSLLCAPAPCTLTQLDLPCCVAHTSARPCSLLRPSPARWPRPRRGFSHGRLIAQPKPRSCTKQQASDSSASHASTRFATLCRRSVQPRRWPQLDLVFSFLRAWIRRRVSLSGGRAHPARLLSSTMDVGHLGLFTNSAARCRVSSTSVPASSVSRDALSLARSSSSLLALSPRLFVPARPAVEASSPAVLGFPAPARSSHGELTGDAPSPAGV